MTEMRRNVVIDGSIRWSKAEYLDWIQTLSCGDECFVQSLSEGTGSTFSAYWRYHRSKILWGTAQSQNGNLYVSDGMVAQFAADGTLVSPHRTIQRIIPCVDFLSDIEQGIAIDCPLYEPRIRNTLKWAVPAEERHIAFRAGAITFASGNHQILVFHPEQPTPNATRF